MNETTTAKRAITHHCSNCGVEVDADGNHEYQDDDCRTARIDSISTLLASDGTMLGVGVLVEGGQRGTQDYDTGRVIEVDGGRALVAWDGSATKDWTPASELRAIRAEV